MCSCGSPARLVRWTKAAATNPSPRTTSAPPAPRRANAVDRSKYSNAAVDGASVGGVDRRLRRRISDAKEHAHALRRREGDVKARDRAAGPQRLAARRRTAGEDLVQSIVGHATREPERRGAPTEPDGLQPRALRGSSPQRQTSARCSPSPGRWPGRGSTSPVRPRACRRRPSVPKPPSVPPRAIALVECNCVLLSRCWSSGSDSCSGRLVRIGLARCASRVVGLLGSGEM